MDLDSDSDSDTSTMEMSDDTTQCLIDSLTSQIRTLQIEVQTLTEANEMLSIRIHTFNSIIKSDILNKIFDYL